MPYRKALILLGFRGTPKCAADAGDRVSAFQLAVAADPVGLRLVESLNRPGGNATGVSFQFVELLPKQLGMLRELAPGAIRFVALVRSNAAFIDTVGKDLQASASVLGVPIEIFRVGTGREIDAAFANIVQKPGSALLVVPDPFFTNRRAQIVTLAARHALPAIYYAPEFAEIGGLMSAV